MQVPIKNDWKTNRWVNNVLIPPGETRIFEDTELPAHLRPERAEPAAFPTQPSDALLELLDNNVEVVVKAIEERDEQGRPVLSDDELIRLAQAEADGKSRVTLTKALEEEHLRRADENLKREDLAVFAESLKEMSAEQLEELKATHQEDPDKLAVIGRQELVNLVDQAVADKDRELLEMMLKEDDVKNDPSAQELIVQALNTLAATGPDDDAPDAGDGDA